MILVKQAPCGKTSEGHLVFLLLKLNMKKKRGLTFGEKTLAYEIWIRQRHPKEQSRRQKKVGWNLSLQRNPGSGHAQELQMHS